MSLRPRISLAAVAALAVVASGCSGSPGSAESTAAGSPSESAVSGSAQAATSGSATATEVPATASAAASGSQGAVIGPIIVEPTETEVSATVGRFLDFNVGPNPGDWTISSDNQAVVGELIQGGERDGATYNPGAKALSVGGATVTLENAQGLEALVFKVAVTE